MAELLSVVSISLRRLLGRPRTAAALLLGAGSLLPLLQDVPAYLQQNELTLQAAEPFLLLTVSRLPQLLLVTAFLLACADAPFFHEGTALVLVRTDKCRWLSAQILAVFAAAALWLCAVLGLSVLWFLPRVSFSGQWSAFMKTAARLGRAGAAVGLRGVEADMELLQGGGPWLVFAVSYLYNLLLFGFCGVWAVMVNLHTRHSWAGLLTVAFCALRLALESLSAAPALRWISPMSLTDLRARELSVGNLAYTVLFFAGHIALLWALSCRRLRRAETLWRQ